MKDERKIAMPYRKGDIELEALHRRLEARLDGHISPPSRRGLGAVMRPVAALAAVAVVAAAVVFAGHSKTVAQPTFEELLSTASPDVLEQFTAQNYDDYFIDFQI